MKKRCMLLLAVLWGLAAPASVLAETAAPAPGTTPGHILDGDAEGAFGWKRFTEPYRAGIPGQCTWYAAGRFREVHGMELPRLWNAKHWAEQAGKSEGLRVIAENLADVPALSIAVFEPTEEFPNAPGHVCFVEYVERDETGAPVQVYYTEANGSGDLRKNLFDPGYDGVVQACGWDAFREPYGLRLIGFIVPDDTVTCVAGEKSEF